MEMMNEENQRQHIRNLIKRLVESKSLDYVKTYICNYGNMNHIPNNIVEDEWKQYLAQNDLREDSNKDWLESLEKWEQNLLFQDIGKKFSTLKKSNENALKHSKNPDLNEDNTKLLEFEENVLPLEELREILAQIQSISVEGQRTFKTTQLFSESLHLGFLDLLKNLCAIKAVNHIKRACYDDQINHLKEQLEEDLNSASEYKDYRDLKEVLKKHKDAYAMLKNKSGIIDSKQLELYKQAIDSEEQELTQMLSDTSYPIYIEKLEKLEELRKKQLERIQKGNPQLQGAIDSYIKLIQTDQFREETLEQVKPLVGQFYYQNLEMENSEDILSRNLKLAEYIASGDLEGLQQYQEQLQMKQKRMQKNASELPEKEKLIEEIINHIHLQNDRKYQLSRQFSGKKLVMSYVSEKLKELWKKHLDKQEKKKEQYKKIDIHQNNETRQNGDSDVMSDDILRQTLAALEALQNASPQVAKQYASLIQQLNDGVLRNVEEQPNEKEEESVSYKK